MKHSFLIFISTLIILLLSGCDNNKGKIEEKTKQFITAVNDNDKASIYDLYPTAKNYSNMEMVETIDDGEVDVEKNDSTGHYIASINNNRSQKLVFSVDENQNIVICDSYGILQLEESSSELALSAGVPLKKISDDEISKLMDEESLFIKYLKEQNYSAEHGTLYEAPGTYSWGTRYGTPYVTFNINIQNSGDKYVSGSDYYIEVDLQRSSTPLGYANIKTCDGVGLAPGERHVFTIDEPAMYRYAVNKDVKWTCTIKYKRDSIIQSLIDYGDFSGKEYSEFQKVKDGMVVRLNGTEAIAVNASEGHVDCYEEPSQNSKVKDTAYHRQSITVVSDEDNEDWYKAYLYEEYDHYKFLGYIKGDNWEYKSSEEGALSPLYISDIETWSEDKSDIPIYKELDKEGSVVKKVKAGTKVMAAYDDDDNYEMLNVYEPDGKGGYKVIGYISSENILEEGD